MENSSMASNLPVTPPAASRFGPMRFAGMNAPTRNPALIPLGALRANQAVIQFAQDKKLKIKIKKTKSPDSIRFRLNGGPFLAGSQTRLPGGVSGIVALLRSLFFLWLVAALPALAASARIKDFGQAGALQQQLNAQLLKSDPSQIGVEPVHPSPLSEWKKPNN